MHTGPPNETNLFILFCKSLMKGLLYIQVQHNYKYCPYYFATFSKEEEKPQEEEEEGTRRRRRRMRIE